MPQTHYSVKIKTSLGQTAVPGTGSAHFQVLFKGTTPLFLGLGPDPGICETLYPGRPGYFVECPQMESQMNRNWQKNIPDSLTRKNPDFLFSPEARDLEIVFYQPGLRYFPEFWAPLLAGLRLGRNMAPSGAGQTGRVLVFGDQQTLLVPEICWELEQKKLKPVLLPDRLDPALLADVLMRLEPDLAISVNLRGLDAFGQNHALLSAMDIPLAIWFVDNPFLLLTRLKSHSWKKAFIFVTDHWFVRPLLNHGAVNISHLPLAAGPGFFQPGRKKIHELEKRIVFVGRTSFPGHRSFFSGTGLDQSLWTQAEELMLTGCRPDFSWWLTMSAVDRLWPGNQARPAGLGADKSGLAWKTTCLQTLADTYSLTVYGNQVWQKLLPQNTDLRPEVDYYGPLASIYASAAVCLNLTNMLLPYGLTQRHFDVWAARGFLITDYTPGLDIFPKELTREIAFQRPEELARLIDSTASRPKLKKEISEAFYQMIRKEHTYAQRIETILESISRPCP